MRKSLCLLLLLVLSLFIFVSCTTTSDVCSIMEQEATNNPDHGDWVEKSYIDSFGDATDDFYITTKNVISGVFSNSATRNSALYVNFFVDSNNICIDLREYRQNNAYVNFYGDSTLKGYYKLGNGDQKRVEFNHSNNRLFVNYLYKESFYKALATGQEMKIYIADNYSSEYLFILNTKGFASAYISAFGFK